ncbi:hypothetical protein L7F22_040980 [Adiantum nelumboides]|nr:hypothetical protein [Adiantum nelumboides]
MTQLRCIERPLFLQQGDSRRKAVAGLSTVWRQDSAPFLSNSTVAFSSQPHAQPVTEEMEQARTSTSIMVSIVSSMSAIPQEDWDACAIDSSGVDLLNPFLLHAFLSSLEDSGSAITEKGWSPQHLVARDESGGILGAVPLYLKSHSYGEYVFDHSWANAYYHFGRSYYPKLQSCVPFTPVTGPRILLRNGPLKAEVANGLLRALQELAHQFKVSSLHVTFPTEEEWKMMGDLGFLQRVGMQYHWLNDGYGRRYVRGFAVLAGPLHDLIKKKVPFNWGPRQKEALEKLKYFLSHGPILKVPDLRKPFEVHCDASGDFIGAVLNQEGHAVAFKSRRLKDVELHASIYEFVFLAVIHALSIWKHYLLGADFVIKTDH